MFLISNCHDDIITALCIHFGSPSNSFFAHTSGADPPHPPQPEMVLASELAEQVPSQPASIDVGQGIAPNLSFTQLPAHDPEIVVEMIHLDPSLQSIDPALIMVGFSQGHHCSTPVGSAVNDTSSPLPPHCQRSKTKERLRS